MEVLLKYVGVMAATQMFTSDRWVIVALILHGLKNNTFDAEKSIVTQVRAPELVDTLGCKSSNVYAALRSAKRHGAIYYEFSRNVPFDVTLLPSHLDKVCG